MTSLVYSLQPDIASAFLRRHIFDTSREDLVRAIDDLVADGDEAALDDFARAAIALESTLDRSMPSDQLMSMVAFDGNVGLEHATDGVGTLDGDRFRTSRRISTRVED